MARIQSTSLVKRDARGHFIKRTIPVAVRRELARRHNCRPGTSTQVQCAYCTAMGQIHWIVQPLDRGQGWVTFTGLEMDHVDAEIAGGDASAENIVLACLPCNRSKGPKTLTTWRPTNG